ncbi:MAG: DUF983 domain-containing protein [Anaerolineaceae bacterium]|nr:DUF983 domain-containing protein [Anaerolineaceae bacterium]
MPQTTSEQLHKILIGAKLRCPNCEQGRMFSGLFQMNPTCLVCGVRFERSSGESLGGMMVNLVVAELLTIVGFFASYFALGSPADMTPLIIFWLVFDILFVLGFYRPARGMWVAITYLTSGLRKDEDSAA